MIIHGTRRSGVNGRGVPRSSGTLVCKVVYSGNGLKTLQPETIDMGEFNVGGLTVEIDGVDRDDLPSAFDFSEMMELAQQGESVDKMAKYVHAQVWVESDRGQEFWNGYTGKTST